MIITPTGLSRAAGACAAIAGAIYIAVQIGHPTMDVASVETAQWVVRDFGKAVMAALALAGITGLYLRQVRRSGVLGLVGYVLFAVGYLAMFSVAVIATTILPVLATSDPAYVRDVLAAAAGEPTVGDIGALQVVFSLSGVGYMIGGLIFGIALFRAHLAPRWASALLAAGTIGTVALAILPESFNRPLAVPVGIALIGLGVWLWRDRLGSNDRAAAIDEIAVR